MTTRLLPHHFTYSSSALLNALLNAGQDRTGQDRTGQDKTRQDKSNIDDELAQDCKHKVIIKGGNEEGNEERQMGKINQ